MEVNLGWLVGQLGFGDMISRTLLRDEGGGLPFVD